MAILAIDQGTTGSTALLFTENGQVQAKTNVEFPQHFPQPGWVEHNPEEIWTSVVKAVQQTIEKAGIEKSEITSIGITNQRETVVVWDRKSGKPVYNAIVWQCRRTSSFCDKLKKEGHERAVRRVSGLVVDAYFSASKINWILNNNKELKKRAKAGELCAGTIDTYLIWRLTDGAHVTDVTNASRTQLMSIKKLAWDEDMMGLFKVPKQLLPEILPSSGEFGHTKGMDFLPDGIPIAGVAGDQQSALFGQACFKAGDVKCTYGTGSFILMNTGDQLVRSKNGLLTTVAWQLGSGKPVYSLEGGAFICGAAVQWLRDQLGIISSSPEIEALAAQVEDTGGVEFVPALAGLGAPYWDQDARGMICGLSRGSGKAEIARATLDAMALQNVDIFECMQKDLGKKMRSLKVDGGASANNLLMQLQADYTGVKTVRPQVIETTAAGAAFLAGLATGVWSSPKQIEDIWQADQEFSPQIAKKARQARLDKWHLAIQRARR